MSNYKANKFKECPAHPNMFVANFSLLTSHISCEHDFSNCPCHYVSPQVRAANDGNMNIALRIYYVLYLTCTTANDSKNVCGCVVSLYIKSNRCLTGINNTPRKAERGRAT